jgi:hypothetical protein
MHELDKVSLSKELVLLQSDVATPSFKFSSHLASCLPLTPSKVKILLIFRTNSSLFRKLMLALLATEFQTPSSVELPSTLCTPAAAVSQQVIQVTKPEALFSLHTPCMGPVPNCTFEEMITKAILSELSETSL